MEYYEVLIADAQYQSSEPLTYSASETLKAGNIVTVPLRGRSVTGFVMRQVQKPDFTAKPIRQLVSQTPLPPHCLDLAHWVRTYWACNLGDVLKLFGPSQTVKRLPVAPATVTAQLEFADFDGSNLTEEQKAAIAAIENSPHHSVLLHGVTGSGKTRVYLELAQRQLQAGKSVLLLTPEIGLTAQLAAMAATFLGRQPVVFHSGLSVAARKKLWRQILESSQPEIVIGPRSALFLPVRHIGLIVLDEAHDNAYKQEQAPRYQSIRVASALASLTGAKAVFGTATPSITDYYLAHEKGALVTMREIARAQEQQETAIQIVDSRRRELFTAHTHLSQPLITAIKKNLAAGRQSLLYLNRRGTARLVACMQCGWQLLCGRCDIPLTYHGDQHQAICHSCGYQTKPPTACPSCGNSEIIYKGIGTKALELAVQRLFSEARIARFDSDNPAELRLDAQYEHLASGDIDIVIGTQMIAKGLDLPRLGLVGIVLADSGLWLPDYTADEQTFQQLSQVIGRVNRGHIEGEVVLQTYQPDSSLINAAAAQNWNEYYTATLQERKQYRFPPFSYLLKIVTRRKTDAGAQRAAQRVVDELQTYARKQKVEVIGPMPSFRHKRGDYFYWQVVCKAKSRAALQDLARKTPHGSIIDLDPSSLL